MPQKEPEMSERKGASSADRLAAAEGQAAVGLDLLGVDHVHIEGWIGHHEVAVAPKGVAVFQPVKIAHPR